MAEAIRKIGQAVRLWAVAAGVLLAVWAPALRLPQLWVLIGISVLANVLQPAYPLTERTERREDRGTFVQIIGTVYAIQVAALVELVVKKPPALPFDAVSWGALGVMVAGLGLRTWAVRVLGRFFTLQIQVQPGQRIIQHGPYRLIRHPSYAGAGLTFIAGCLLLRSWVAAGVAAIALTAAFGRRIRYEERLLATRCPAYAAYAARTGALLPRLL